MRIVLDTNVIVSAYITCGPARDFWDRVTFQHTVLISPEVFTELEGVLRSEQFNYSDERIAEILRDVLGRVQLVRVRLKYCDPMCDPSDVCIAALALQEEPTAVVTGDKPLRAEHAISAIQVLSIREFENIY